MWIFLCGRWRSAPLIAALLLLLPIRATAEPDHEELAARARGALTTAVAYFRGEVAVQGSYVWRYSADFSFSRGEAVTTRNQGWVQPPGTPGVGMAFLQAYAATGDARTLDGAVDAAHALAATQLDSGGWHQLMELDPERRKGWCYRHVPVAERDPEAIRENRFCDASSIDDNISQSALELLMRVDVALDGADPVIGDAVAYGLERFIAAQYPNGAWPVRFDRRVADGYWAAWRARYPKTWSRTQTEWPALFFAINDNVMGDMIRVFLVAHQLYGDDKYLATAIRGGEFLLAAQMPEPQPAWAQQYNREMEPMWARKFEPPAIASWETQRTITTLLDLYLYTGKVRYLEAAGPAAAWLEHAQLADGQWARYYELETDRPLYVSRDYQLTYDGSDTPTHYGFKSRFDVARVLERYRRVAAAGRFASTEPQIPAAPTSQAETTAAELAPQAEAVVAALDDRGRWLDDRGMIRSKTFIANVDLLARYLAAVDGRVLPRLALLDR